MADLLEVLESEIVLGDGAMGTLLHERGLPANQCVEGLVLSDAERIEKIHRVLWPVPLKVDGMVSALELPCN